MMFLPMVAVLFSLNAHAQTTNNDPSIFDKIEAVQAAIDGSDSFLDALENRDFMGITHEQMGHAMEVLAADLRARNDDGLANELMNNWHATQFRMFSNLKNLGDHDPLFPWLENFFAKMANQYGTIIYSLPYVSDLRTLNFAIPVVFTPHGRWHAQGVDNRIEYRKHFIPFANIITYYASYYGCIYLIEKNGLGQLKQLCGKVADKLKFLMGRYAAPVISDWIYKGSNSSSMLATAPQLRSITAEQLLNSINNGE